MMTRKSFVFVSAFLALGLVAGPASASVQPDLELALVLADQQRPDRLRERGRDRQPDRSEAREERREMRRQAPSMQPGDAARRVGAGRDGRMLGIRPAGGGYVVRWEYPGGRVSDIRVDGSGQVSGG